VICKRGNPTARQTSKLAQRVARDLKAAGWQMERMLSDNGNEFRGLDFTMSRTCRHISEAAKRPAQKSTPAQPGRKGARGLPRAPFQLSLRATGDAYD
jgi:hypothetical protein